MGDSNLKKELLLKVPSDVSVILVKSRSYPLPFIGKLCYAAQKNKQVKGSVFATILQASILVIKISIMFYFPFKIKQTGTET